MIGIEKSKYDYLNDHNSFLGSLSLDNRITMGLLVNHFRIKSVIEIGTLFGFTANFFNSMELEVTTVDNYTWEPFEMTPEEHKEFTRNVLHIDVNQVVLNLEEDSRDQMRKKCPRNVDMVFIDADHKYDSVIKDLEYAYETATKLIVGHDYLPVVHQDVVDAVDKFVDKNNLKLETKGNLFYIVV